MIKTQSKLWDVTNVTDRDITEIFWKRDDVAVLALLVDREDAGGLGIDLVGGDSLIDKGLDAFIKKGKTDFLD